MAESDPTTPVPSGKPPTRTEHISLFRRLWAHHRENAVAVAVIVGTLATMGAVVFAYLQLHDQTSVQSKTEAAQRQAEITGQAERVSASTIGGDGGFPITSEPGNRSVTRVAIYNRSSAPVYDAVVTLVLVQGAGPKTGRELKELDLKREFQRDLTAVPPGVSETQVAPGWAGMMARPGIEIAFTDQHGRNWLRYSDGELVSIPVPAASYYRLGQPVNWIAPTNLQGK